MSAVRIFRAAWATASCVVVACTFAACLNPRPDVDPASDPFDDGSGGSGQTGSGMGGSGAGGLDGLAGQGAAGAAGTGSPVDQPGNNGVDAGALDDGGAPDDGGATGLRSHSDAGGEDAGDGG